jgi:membrane protein DedA with SNARE-associated domain
VAILSGLQGPIIILLGASMAASGLLNPEGVFFAASLGNLCFDFLWYSLGRAGKIEWLLNHWLRPHRKRIERLHAVISRHVVKILVLAKLTDGFVLPTLIAMGIARVPIKRWIVALVTVEIFKTGSLVLIGYHFARIITQVMKGLSYLTFVGSFLFLLAVGYAIFRLLNLGKRFDQFVDGEDKTGPK